MRAIALAVIVSAVAIGGVERLYRAAGGLPSVVPGLTRIEFQWKIQQTLGRAHVAYVVGDSRAGWGFAERVFNREYARLGSAHDVRAVNAGLAASSITADIKYVLDSRAGGRPQALVVNYSPVGCYQFVYAPGPPIPGLKIQDVLDDHLDSLLAERLWTRARGRAASEQIALYRRQHAVSPVTNWVRRTVDADGFVNGTLATNTGVPVDNPATQLLYFTQFIAAAQSDPSAPRRRRDEFTSMIHEALGAGWTVVLVRFPIGPRMRDLENMLPADLRPDAVALAGGVPLLDYTADARTAWFSTLDESHLTPDAARALAPILARDLFRFLQ
jgi:hypothetical protein